MEKNYHTHTPRCGHAWGSEREYIECALARGLKVLGFSDHTPYDFFDVGPRDRPMRMKPEELPEYAGTLLALAEEYRERIQILAGLEAEYYPKYFPRLLDMVRQAGIRFLILGQHSLGNEVGEPYCGRRTEDPVILRRYVAQSVEALQTGVFSYFAHPDILWFEGDEREYDRQMRRLCRTALECGVPLEINLLGLRTGRNYPDERFWRIAGEEGNTAILGADAHRPQDLLNTDSEARALEMAERYGLRLTDSPDLRRI